MFDRRLKGWGVGGANPSIVKNPTYTASQKHESTLLHSTYVCTEQFFDSRPFMYNTIFLKKTLKEVGSSHLYASFGTFCVQIGHLFEAQ